MKDMEHYKRFSETTGKRKQVLMRDCGKMEINDIPVDKIFVVEHSRTLLYFSQATDQYPGHFVPIWSLLAT